MSKDKKKESETNTLKLLGAQVDESVYWEFKKVASKRKETMQEAIVHAALLYMDLKEGESDE